MTTAATEPHGALLEECRAFALALPEATEAPHFEKNSFRVRGKIFATVPESGQHLHVFVEEAVTRALATEAPEAFEELWWGKQLSGVRINLAAADPEQVNELLELAWRRKAPKALLQERGDQQR